MKMDNNPIFHRKQRTDKETCLICSKPLFEEVEVLYCTTCERKMEDSKDIKAEMMKEKLEYEHWGGE